jgi:hypothetical protein|tara:strand:- start:1361 stop:1789 length:429 start_codon:yes stop_codon:yes gene_type:complete
MITFLANVGPILIGFLMKLSAIKSQQASDAHKMMLEAMAVKSDIMGKARLQSNRESPMAALNRRVLIFVILGLVAIYPIAGLLGVDTTIPVVREGFSFLGIFKASDTIEMVKVKGLFKFDEIFSWCTLIVEFYFGAQLAKAA